MEDEKTVQAFKFHFLRKQAFYKNRKNPHAVKLRNIDLSFTFLAKEYIRYLIAEPDKGKHAETLVTKEKRKNLKLYIVY